MPQKRVATPRSRWRKALRVSAFLLGLFTIAIGSVAIAIWQSREERVIPSSALSEQRRVLLFNTVGGDVASSAPVLVVLDGERVRHGLATALQARLIAWLHGRAVPVVVGVDSQGSRDTDFRNTASDPAGWRPKISGHAQRFDAFLIADLLPWLQSRVGPGRRYYLLGHSLTGLYAVDLASRQPQSKPFSGFFAFSPTFSHDRSVLTRLGQACASRLPVLITIGLESAREQDLFDQAEQVVKQATACRDGKIKFERHPAMIHQIVMLTGQTSALQSLIISPE